MITANHIEYSTGATHDNMGRGFTQIGGVVGGGSPANKETQGQASHHTADTGDDIIDLFSELAGGGENKRLGLGFSNIDTLKCGDRECAGLAGS